jgi:hypothetical protein
LSFLNCKVAVERKPLSNPARECHIIASKLSYNKFNQAQRGKEQKKFKLPA